MPILENLPASLRFFCVAALSLLWFVLALCVSFVGVALLFENGCTFDELTGNYICGDGADRIVYNPSKCETHINCTVRLRLCILLFLALAVIILDYLDVPISIYTWNKARRLPSYRSKPFSFHFTVVCLAFILYAFLWTFTPFKHLMILHFALAEAAFPLLKSYLNGTKLDYNSTFSAISYLAPVTLIYCTYRIYIFANYLYRIDDQNSTSQDQASGEEGKYLNAIPIHYNLESKNQEATKEEESSSSRERSITEEVQTDSTKQLEQQLATREGALVDIMQLQRGDQLKFQEVQVELDGVQTQFEEYRDESERARAEMMDSLAKSENAQADFNKELSDFKTQVEGYEVDSDKAQADFNKELSDFKTQVESYKVDSDKAQADFNKELSDFKTQVEGYEVDFDKAQAEMMDSLAKSENAQTDFNKDLSDFKTQVESYFDKAEAEMIDSLAKSENAQADFNKDLSDFKTQVESYFDKAQAEMMDSLAKSENAQADFNQDLSDFKTQVESYEVDFDKAQAEMMDSLAKSEKARADFNKELSGFKTQVEGYKVDSDKAQARFDEELESIRSLHRHNLEALTDANTLHKDILSTATTRKDLLTDVLSAATTRNVLLTDFLSAATTTNVLLRRNLTNNANGRPQEQSRSPCDTSNAMSTSSREPSGNSIPIERLPCNKRFNPVQTQRSQPESTDDPSSSTSRHHASNSDSPDVNQAGKPDSCSEPPENHNSQGTPTNTAVPSHSDSPPMNSERAVSKDSGSNPEPSNQIRQSHTKSETDNTNPLNLDGNHSMQHESNVSLNDSPEKEECETDPFCDNNTSIYAANEPFQFNIHFNSSLPQICQDDPADIESCSPRSHKCLKIPRSSRSHISHGSLSPLSSDITTNDDGFQ